LPDRVVPLWNEFDSHAKMGAGGGRATFDGLRNLDVEQMKRVQYLCRLEQSLLYR
jgi:hypothetical protein